MRAVTTVCLSHILLIAGIGRELAAVQGHEVVASPDKWMVRGSASTWKPYQVALGRPDLVDKPCVISCSGQRILYQRMDNGQVG
jgi:hypothetical protein